MAVHVSIHDEWYSHTSRVIPDKAFFLIACKCKQSKREFVIYDLAYLLELHWLMRGKCIKLMLIVLDYN